MTSSYNGWPASPDPKAIAVDSGFRAASAAGGPIRFPGGVKAGDVSTVLRYVAESFFATVEPPVFGADPGQPKFWGYGCWGYNYRANANNPNNLSNHSSGTALDLNATLHPNGKRGTFTSAQVKSIRAILSTCQGAVYWGGDYSGIPDEMHFDIYVSASTLARVAASLPGSPPEQDWCDVATKQEIQDAITAALQPVYAKLDAVVAATEHNDLAATQLYTFMASGEFATGSAGAMARTLSMPDYSGVRSWVVNPDE